MNNNIIKTYLPGPNFRNLMFWEVNITSVSYYCHTRPNLQLKLGLGSYKFCISVVIDQILARAGGVPAVGIWAVDCWQ